MVNHQIPMEKDGKSHEPSDSYMKNVENRMVNHEIPTENIENPMVNHQIPIGKCWKSKENFQNSFKN